MAADLVLQSNPVNFEAVRHIESVRANGVSVIAGLIKRKCKGFLCLGIKQTVYTNEVFVLSGCLKRGLTVLCVSFVIQQHQQQLVSLQQHKEQLEKHKKELEDLSLWSLWSKTDPWMPPPPSVQAFPPPTLAQLASPSASSPINLAQQKKQAGSNRKQEGASGAPVSQPVQQHVMQV